MLPTYIVQPHRAGGYDHQPPLFSDCNPQHLRRAAPLRLEAESPVAAADIHDALAAEVHGIHLAKDWPVVRSKVLSAWRADVWGELDDVVPSIAVECRAEFGVGHWIRDVHRLPGRCGAGPSQRGSARRWPILF